MCLGHQLLALALRRADRTSCQYGHRGGNQPVKDLVHDEVLVTAHNHGYAVDGETLPAELEATMINLNDGTNEGFRHRTLPVEAVQFHPEASPGPFDARNLFARWLDARRGASGALRPSRGSRVRRASPPPAQGAARAARRRALDARRPHARCTSARSSTWRSTRTCANT